MSQVRRSRFSFFSHRQALYTWLAIALIVVLQVQIIPQFEISSPSSRDAFEAGTSASKPVAQANYAKLPLAFEPNQGQVDSAASFIVHHGKAITYFSNNKTVTDVGDSQITMSLDSASTPIYQGVETLESKTNYLIGNDQSKWQSNVPNYKKILAKNVYPGIDLAYYGTNTQLEHDFIVSPNTDYKQISFHFDGQDNLSLDKDGNLVLKTKDVSLQLNAPITYQQTPNSKHTIPSRFELKDNTVTVAVNDTYDKTQPLVIDPVLVYSTYLGGSGVDDGTSITADSAGNTYVTGSTYSPNFPTASPLYASRNGSNGRDVFITKFNSSGSALVYSTYLGGSTGTDYGKGIAVDASGNAYVTGITTANDFPTVSAYDATFGGGVTNYNDAFLFKLNSAGSTLIYSTYIGGTVNDDGNGIALDGSNNAYITGSSSSPNYPRLSSIQGYSGGTNVDVIISKFNSSGGLAYSTYLGGSGNDRGYGISVDSSGNAYIGGLTTSTNFPVRNAYQSTNPTTSVLGFVAKINPAGSATVYSTYLGGANNASPISAIAVDSSGRAYVAGYTSGNFPTQSPVQATMHGAVDMFITRFNAAGSALEYSTYWGGSNNDFANGIDLDASNNAYVTGYTDSTDFPTVSPLQASHGGGTHDAFVVKLNSAGSSMDYASYLGGSNDDVGYGIVSNTSDKVNITGTTVSTNFPTATSFQSSYGGDPSDAFVTQLDFNPPLPVTNATSLSTPAIGATGVTYTETASNQLAVAVKCVQVSFTDTKGATNKPTGMSISAATLGGASTFFPTPANWTVSNNNTTGVISITNNAGETMTGGNGKTLILNNITNGTVSNTTYYVEVRSYSDTACTAQVDYFDPTFVFTADVTVSAQVNPTLTFTVGSTSCDLGALSISQTKQCTYSMTAATNGQSGYNISYIPASTLTSGANTVTALASQTASTLNSEQFGINLRANTAAVAHTASNFGADVSGGVGAVDASYNTINQFMFSTAGDIIAASTTPSLTSTFTISTIGNITNTTEAGAYTTTLTYNIVAGY